MGDISVPDIAVPDISQIKTELDIKKEPEEPAVKEETDDTTGDNKPKEEQPDIKSEPGTLYILKGKRNATLSKTVVSSSSSQNSASDNVIAKYRYLPCIQHQNQTAVTYGWRAAMRNVRQPQFLKSQSSKIVPILGKNVLNQYLFLKAKG